MDRLSRLRHNLRRVVVRLKITVDDLIRPPKPLDLEDDAFLHQPIPGHPSLNCKCPNGGAGHWDGEHLADCPWLAAMCKDCLGTGWCRGCGGDGCNYEKPSEASAARDDNGAFDVIGRSKSFVTAHEKPVQSQKCAKCDDKGWYETGNNDLICTCAAGSKYKYGDGYRGQIVPK